MRDEDEDQWGALMTAAQQGNGGAYRRLLGELRVWLVRYFARRLPPALVEDAVQDALIAVHEKRHTYDPARPFRPWLAAVARYKWIDRLRAMNRERTDELPDGLSIEDHESGITSAVVLEELLGRLKPAQQQVIKLVKIEGMSIDEASERTGQSASLVKVNIHRGIKQLAAYIEEAPDGE